LWETRIKHTVPASNQVELNGDSMLELHRNQAFHQGKSFRMVCEEGALKKKQSDSCWNVAQEVCTGTENHHSPTSNPSILRDFVAVGTLHTI
jgi:hypothetical protein